MPTNTDDRQRILDNAFVQIDFDDVNAVPGEMRSNHQDDINVILSHSSHEPVPVDCASEKTFWKYARCILYLNAWISPFRVMIYVLVCLFRILLCEYRKAKSAAGEVLKSVLVLFTALAAVAVTQDLVEISNCIAEVLFEFVIGGLTLQICLGVGDALIDCVLDCTTVNLTTEKILESILEPIVFFGGIFSIYSYVKADKDTANAQHAKYSAIGNLIGSSVAVTLASYLCFRIEETSYANTTQIYSAPTPLIMNDEWNQSTFGEDHFGQDLTNLYDKKNSILAMNILARMFAEGIAKCVEHKCTKKVHE